MSNLSHWLLSALLKAKSSSQPKKFKLSGNSKFDFQKTHGFWRASQVTKRHLACTAVPGYGCAISQVTKRHLKAPKWLHSRTRVRPCKPSDKTSLGLHAKIYYYLVGWKRCRRNSSRTRVQQTQQSKLAFITWTCTAVPGYSRRNNQKLAFVTWTCTAVPGYSRRNNQKLAFVTWTCTAVPGYSRRNNQKKHLSLGLARPYPGTVVQVQVTDADDADATIKNLSVCTAVPGYSRRKKILSVCTTWVQQTPHSKSKLLRRPPSWIFLRGPLSQKKP